MYISFNFYLEKLRVKFSLFTCFVLFFTVYQSKKTDKQSVDGLQHSGENKANKTATIIGDKDHDGSFNRLHAC